MKNLYRVEIDGLRALAVVVVIINHFSSKIVPHGYLGVDIFFVISGYVITSSLSQNKSNNLFDLISNFYTRRFKRLLPALFTVVFVAGILTLLFNPIPDLSLRTGIASLFGLSNFYLYRQSSDYFSPFTELNPFAHTWSLGVEEQFYLIFPIIIWLTGFPRKGRQGSILLALSLIIMSIISYSIFALNISTNSMFAYYLMPSRFWEISIGCIGFIVYKESLVNRNLSMLTGPLIIIIISAIFFPWEERLFITTSVVISTILLLLSLNKDKKYDFVYRFLSNKFIIHIGLISYSLYLWHWVILSVSRLTIGIHWWSTPIQLIAIYLLANMTYQYIEQPIRRINLRPLKTLLVAVSGSLGLSLFFHLLSRSEIYLGRKPGSIHTTLGGEILLKEVPPAKNCEIFDFAQQRSDVFDECSVDYDPEKSTIFLLGDSHSFQYKDPIAAFARDNKYNFLNLWGIACPFPPSFSGIRGNECFEEQLKVQEDLLQRVKKDDVVFINNNLYSYFQDPAFTPIYKDPVSNVELSREIGAKYLSDQIVEVSNILTKKGAKVVLYIDGVKFTNIVYPGWLCKEEWFRPSTAHIKGCISSRSKQKQAQEIYFGWIKDWENKIDKFRWDASIYQLGCNGDDCRADYYSDNNHFTSPHSAYVFKRFLDSNMSLFSKSE